MWPSVPSQASLLIFSTRDNSFLILPLTGKGRTHRLFQGALLPSLPLITPGFSVVIAIAKVAGQSRSQC